MLGLLLFISAARAACTGAVTLDQLSAGLRQAEAAFAASDAPQFLRATASAREALPCLAEPLTPGVAAAWHRADALERIVSPQAEERPAMLAALRAMSNADPGYQFPRTLAPEGSVLPSLLEEAEALPPAERVRVEVPDRTLLLFDGQPGREWAGGLPVLVQVMWRDDLSVHLTLALGPGQAMPDLAALGALPPPIVSDARLSRPATLAAAGGALALSLVAGGALGWGEANRAAFHDPATDYAAVPGLVDRSHALSFTAIGAGVGAVGLGALVVFAGQL